MDSRASATIQAIIIATHAITKQETRTPDQTQRVGIADKPTKNSTR